jgi:hypothetical protein
LSPAPKNAAAAAISAMSQPLSSANSSTSERYKSKFFIGQRFQNSLFEQAMRREATSACVGNFIGSIFCLYIARCRASFAAGAA